MLERVVARFHLVLHAYCMMSNHFHLLVETPDTQIPRAQRFAARPSLSQLLSARLRANRAQRDAVIRRIYLEHGYSLSEIGRAARLHYSTVSRIVSAATKGRA